MSSFISRAVCAAVAGGRKSSQGFARLMMEVVMLCWRMKSSFSEMEE